MDSEKKTVAPSPTPPKLGLFDVAKAKANAIDRSLLMPVSQLIEELTDYEKQIVDPETGYAITLERITVYTSIELKVTVNSNGTVAIKSAPPTQLFPTTIMPVFHHIQVRIAREDDE